MAILDIIQNSRPNINGSTLKAYETSFRAFSAPSLPEELRLLKDGGIPETIEPFLDFPHIKKIVDNMKGKDGETPITFLTKRARLTAALIAVGTKEEKDEVILEKYRKEIRRLNDKYDRKLIKERKHFQEDNNWLERDQIDKVRILIERDIKKQNIMSMNELNQHQYYFLQEYLIVAIYTILRPRRLADFAPMYVVDSEEDIEEGKNYLINPDETNKNKKMIIQDYKTAKHYGRVEFKMNAKLAKIINMVRQYNNEPTLLLNKRVLPMTSNQLGKVVTDVFKRYTGKHITVTQLRKLYVSQNIDMMELEKADKIAYDMAHSTKVQRKYYFKKNV